MTPTDSIRPMSERSRAPVFVVGCPRSGTTLLYHMLISAGDFVNYRAESHVFNVIAPKYGRFGKPATRRRFMEEWTRTDYFEKTGLGRVATIQKIVESADTWGDFLRIIMQAMAEQQQVRRWAECTPDHVLHLDEIAATIPDAVVVHMLRDGRDVALSLDRLGWIDSLPLDRRPGVFPAGAYWNWIIGAGRATAGRSGLPCMEVRFEHLVQRPRATLAEISEFLDYDLDFERIQRNSVGSVQRPNSSFGRENSENQKPVGRWRNHMSNQVLEAFEESFGPRLGELGYPLATVGSSTTRSTYERIYSGYFSVKRWAKKRTPFGRMLVRTHMGNGSGTNRNIMEPRHAPGGTDTPGA